MPTEDSALTTEARVRAELTLEHGPTWNTDELQRDYIVEGFATPFVVVIRRSDNVRGSLMFQHRPRFYFGFVADNR